MARRAPLPEVARPADALALRFEWITARTPRAVRIAMRNVATPGVAQFDDSPLGALVAADQGIARGAAELNVALEQALPALADGS